MAGGGIASVEAGVLVIRPLVCIGAGSDGGPSSSSSSRSVFTSSAGNLRKNAATQLVTPFTDSWQDCRSAAASLWRRVPSPGVRQGQRRPLVVCELGGNYEESFADVDKNLLDYFTYKAVKTVLAQLAEMNPQQYAWFYNFVANNKPQDSKLFLRILVKEKQELGERVMVTRLHLFNKWVKKYNHAQMYKAISDQNLELLRERLIQTVKLTSDGDDIERPPLRGS